MILVTGAEGMVGSHLGDVFADDELFRTDMVGSASAALATAVIASYLATGSSISTRSIFQPCGTNTPNFVDRAIFSP